ncbi:MAG: hypothetical protein OXI15_11210 [Chromatiales bacterium]|nr:hypothetical protein [Chromatiales bacterium]
MALDSHNADVNRLLRGAINETKCCEDEAVDALHRRCGVYTTPDVASRILNAVGWCADVDLRSARLLEPGAGGGEFVVQAAERLVACCRMNGAAPKIDVLRDRIVAFELHPDAAREARSRVVGRLREMGIHHRTAEACGEAWIQNADFLLSCASQSGESGYTHVVGNPPYVRWSKIPAILKTVYERRLPREVTHGDLFLAFLDRALDALQPGGLCGFLCSDRWQYTVSARNFRQKWLPLLDVVSNDPIDATEAFTRSVSTYPTILIATKRSTPRLQPSPTTARRTGRTLKELGCTVKVGPALGTTPAFVLEPDEDGIEPELLVPWVSSSEIFEGTVRWRGRRVVAMFDDAGILIDPRRFPALAERLEGFVPALKKRSIVRNGAPWYRTIDRVRASDWSRPKLLVPELAKIPRVAVDRSGSIPSHGVYAIFACDDEVDGIYEKLRDGRLARALEGIAPKVKGGYVRCYRRFLSMIRL